MVDSVDGVSTGSIFSYPPPTSAGLQYPPEGGNGGWVQDGVQWNRMMEQDGRKWSAKMECDGMESMEEMVCKKWSDGDGVNGME